MCCPHLAVTTFHLESLWRLLLPLQQSIVKIPKVSPRGLSACLLHTIVCQITHSTRDVLFWVWQYPPYPSYNGNFILFWDTIKNIPRHLMTEGEIIFLKHTLSMKKYKRRLFLFFDFPVCFFFNKKIGRYIYFHKSPIFYLISEQACAGKERNTLICLLRPPTYCVQEWSKGSR